MHCDNVVGGLLFCSHYQMSIFFYIFNVCCCTIRNDDDYVSALVQVLCVAIAISRFNDYVCIGSSVGGAANVNSTKRTHSHANSHTNTKLSTRKTFKTYTAYATLTNALQRLTS